MSKCWKRLCREDAGQDLTEYALLLLLVCVIAVGAMNGFASSVSNMYTSASGSVITATVEGSAGHSLAPGSPSIHAAIFSEKQFDNDVLTKPVKVHSTER